MPPESANSKAAAAARAKKKIVGKEMYLVFGLLILLVAVGIVYGSGFLSDKVIEYKTQLEDLQDRHSKAQSRSVDLATRVKQAQSESSKLEQKFDRWKDADSRLNKPWTINAADWMLTRARDQQPPIVTEGTTSEASTKDKRGSVDITVSGNFKGILRWLMDCESELDVVQVVKAVWSPRDSNTVELVLKVEVADE